jgi:hypothetical protein
MGNTNLALVVQDARFVILELILTTQYLLFTAAMALIVLLFSLVHMEAMWPHQLWLWILTNTKFSMGYMQGWSIQIGMVGGV